MTYLLDTSACVTLLRRGDSRTTARLDCMDGTEVAVCSIVKAELFYGAWHSAQPAKNLQALDVLLADMESLPFDDQAADEYGRLRAELTRTGAMIGPNDLLIAAIAIARNAVLVTENAREFSRVPGLSVENWEEDTGENR